MRIQAETSGKQACCCLMTHLVEARARGSASLRSKGWASSVSMARQCMLPCLNSLSII